MGKELDARVRLLLLKAARNLERDGCKFGRAISWRAVERGIFWSLEGKLGVVEDLSVRRSSSGPLTVRRPKGPRRISLSLMLQSGDTTYGVRKGTMNWAFTLSSEDLRLFEEYLIPGRKAWPSISDRAAIESQMAALDRLAGNPVTLRETLLEWARTPKALTWA